MLKIVKETRNDLIAVSISLTALCHCVADYTLTAIEVSVIFGVVILATIGVVHFVRFVYPSTSLLLLLTSLNTAQAARRSSLNKNEMKIIFLMPL